jgi:hypothetical protein
MLLSAVILSAAVAISDSEPREGSSFQRTLLIQSVGAGADLFSTEWALKHGAVEKNPIMRGSTAKRVALKSLQVGVATWGAEKLEKDGHKGWAKVVRWGVPALNVLVAAHNMRVAK